MEIEELAIYEEDEDEVWERVERRGVREAGWGERGSEERIEVVDDENIP